MYSSDVGLWGSLEKDQLKSMNLDARRGAYTKQRTVYDLAIYILLQNLYYILELPDKKRSGRLY